MAVKVSVKIERDRCAGCGACESRVPSVFAVKGDKSGVSYPIQDETENLVNASKNCPREAIKLKVISRW